MDINKQTQQAGEGSQQIQATNVTIINNNGPTEEQVNERVKKVVKELIPVAIKEYTEEARETANERIAKLENFILPRISQVDGMLESFADPAFQRLLVKAEQEAAVSERNADYELLTELLVCHVQKGDDRKNRAGIIKATEIVDMVDNDALCGLTIINTLESIKPAWGNVSEGLAILNRLYKKLEYMDLPMGIEWLEHLDALGAIRLSSGITTLKKFSEYYPGVLTGYACVGIKKGSEEHKKAVELLSTVNIGLSGLADNCFLDGYVRLEIVNKNHIDSLKIADSEGVHNIRPDEKKIFEFIDLVKNKQEKGITVIVITKNPNDLQFDNPDYANYLICHLKQAGIIVELYENLDNHYALIDQEIVWHGGINLLGRPDIYDNLIRLKSVEIATELLTLDKNE